MARSDSTSHRLPLADIHDILMVPRRRRLVRALSGRDEWVDIEDLAEEIVDPDDFPGSADTVDDALENLEWDDVPLLHGKGVLHHDRIREAVHPGEHLETVVAVDDATQSALDSS